MKLKIKRQEERKQKQEQRQQNEMIVDAAENQAGKRKKEKQEEKRRLKSLKTEEAQLPAPPSTSSSDQPTTKKHGVKVDENTNRSYWKGKPVAYLKTQAELMGHRFTDEEMKGSKKLVKGKMEKVKKFGKSEYLNVIYGLLKI